MKISLSRGICQIKAFVDSMIIIQKFHNVKKLQEKDSSPMSHKIWMQIRKFELIPFVHIKRENNQRADEKANIGETLGQGTIILNQGDPYITSIP